MKLAGVVTIFLGVFIIFSRGPLLLFPASMLQWFGTLLSSEARTRVLGVLVVPISGAMIWAGTPQSTTLETVLFVLGVFFLLFTILGLLLLPRIYMNLAHAFLPDDLTGSLFGWRLLGLLGVIIGVAILLVGIDAL